MVLSSGKVSQARSPPAEDCDPLNATGRLVGPEASKPAPGGLGEVWAREVEFFITGWEQSLESGLELGIDQIKTDEELVFCAAIWFGVVCVEQYDRDD